MHLVVLGGGLVDRTHFGMQERELWTRQHRLLTVQRSSRSDPTGAIPGVTHSNHCEARCNATYSSIGVITPSSAACAFNLTARSRTNTSMDDAAARARAGTRIHSHVAFQNDHRPVKVRTVAHLPKHCSAGSPTCPSSFCPLSSFFTRPCTTKRRVSHEFRLLSTPCHALMMWESVVSALPSAHRAACSWHLPGASEPTEMPIVTWLPRVTICFTRHRQLQLLSISSSHLHLR